MQSFIPQTVQSFMPEIKCLINNVELYTGLVLLIQQSKQQLVVTDVLNGYFVFSFLYDRRTRLL